MKHPKRAQIGTRKFLPFILFCLFYWELQLIVVVVDATFLTVSSFLAVKGTALVFLSCSNCSAPRLNSSENRATETVMFVKTIKRTLT